MSTSTSKTAMAGVMADNPGISGDEMFTIYINWAKHFANKGNSARTLSCLDECLRLKPNNSKVLYLRSLCKQRIARSRSALEDALAASKIESYNAKISLQVCAALHALNEFEQSEVELYDNTRKYSGAVVATFKSRLEATNENIDDCLGEALHSFLLKYRNHFPLFWGNLQRKRKTEKRPLWKIMKDLGECDVVSIEEEKEVLLSPLEIVRSERLHRIFNQIYLGRNWADKMFLHDMTNNKKWQIPTFMESTPTLKNILRPNYEIAKKFTKMLHARSPMYSEYYKKFGNQKLLKTLREDYLYKVQYETRRSMFIILNVIRNYRKQGNIEAMAKYIEHVMGDHITMKTYRTMPRKFEFINEVYNILGLAYADHFIIPPDIGSEEKSKDSLQNLLNVSTENQLQSSYVEFVFGDRSTHKPAESVHKSDHLKKQKYLTHLEERLVFAKYWIEKCYLWHEIARTHLKSGFYVDCIRAARKAIDSSKHCNSNLWAFLGNMLIVKSLAAQNKVENCQEVILEATELASSLKDSRLIEFVKLANNFNEHGLALKKRIGTTWLYRRRWHGMSSSQSSQNSSEKSLLTLNKKPSNFNR